MSCHEHQHDRLFKILIVGDQCVGKTSLSSRYVEDVFRDNYVTTIGLDFKIKTIQLGSETIKLQIWDIIGDEKFGFYTGSNRLRGAHGIIVVYDVTDYNSFRGLKTWMTNIDRFANENVDVIIIGNKCDLVQLSAVDYEVGKQFAYSKNALFFETSAKNSINVEECFTALAAKIQSRCCQQIPS